MTEDRSSRATRSSPSAAKDQPRWFDRLLSLGRSRYGASSLRDDLVDVLDHGDEAGEFSAKEGALLRNVLSLHELKVHDAMVPRADIIAVSEDASLAEILAVFRSAGHSRLPVYGETLDDPRGMVHIRDFVDYLAAPATSDDAADSASFAAPDLTASLNTTTVLRPVLFVPPSMPALDLLVRMQASRTHMALVIDEYGGTDGLVSMEDVVELIVGDIEDEHDHDVGPLIAAADNGCYDANARADLDVVSQTLGMDLADENSADEIDTIGGLVVLLAGRVPEQGEVIAGPHDLSFEILEADARRLKRIRIHRQGLAAPLYSTDGASAIRAMGEAPAAVKARPSLHADGTGSRGSAKSDEQSA